MKKLKNWLLGSSLLLILLTLSGCVRRLEDGSPDPSGLIYQYLVEPLGKFLTLIAENWNVGFGWAIIIVTIIVRFIILPLGINQAKKSIVQTEKMQYLKPQLDIVQARVKNATTQEEQLKAQTDMQRVYKENNLSMLGGVGCLPLLIQMPIFTALFYTARYTPGIDKAVFLGIPLGKSSLILVAIAGIAYVIQGYLSLVGIPEEQKKTMKSMLIVSPLMIVMMSLSAPAGVTLYWVVGGIFGCLQTFITNVIMKPRIKKKVAEEMKINPPKIVVTEEDPLPTQNPKQAAKKDLNSSKTASKGRNAGKQQQRKN